MMVIGPLRVTLENFRSMFAPVGFSVARNNSVKVAAGTHSITQASRASQAIFHRPTLLDLGLVFQP
jgi:hypothetical protein